MQIKIGDPVRIGPDASVCSELRGDTGWVTRIVQDGFVAVAIHGTEFTVADADLITPLIAKDRAIVGIPPVGFHYRSSDGYLWVFTGRHKVVSCAWAYSVRRSNRRGWVYLRDFQKDVARKLQAARVA